ncbi:MAG: thioredoxin fold domain-containing protein [Candidatus Thiodiazotropha sp.]
MAEHKMLPLADDLSTLAKVAQQQGSPILLMVSQKHCAYCKKLKQEVLHPMQLDPDFQQQVILRELLIDAGEVVIDFKGQAIDAAEFAHRYGVFVTPTLLFLDSNGEEAAERIVGINTLDYLSFYIQQAITTAKEKAFHYKRSQKSLNIKP